MKLRTIKHMAIATVLAVGMSAYSDIAKLGVLVVDDTTGKPIPNVKVTGVFHKDNGWMAVKGTARPDTDEAVTDANGRCRLWGWTNNGKTFCCIDSAPTFYYWQGRGSGYNFHDKNLLGVWQPDNVVVTIRLQRVEHPIPLFVKNALLNDGKGIFPKDIDTICYDVIVGDWLPPVGRGKIADIEFNRHPRKILGEVEIFAYDGKVKRKAYRDSLSIRFKGEDNGLVEMNYLPGSRLRIRNAPENGYKNDYLRWKGSKRIFLSGGWWLRDESNYEERRCFCFRIRTRRDKNGTIAEAYYGKIYGDFHIGYENRPADKVETVGFFYYLNPKPLDRNLEWDRKTNLCPNPGEMGNVGDRDP